MIPLFFLIGKSNKIFFAKLQCLEYPKFGIHFFQDEIINNNIFIDNISFMAKTLTLSMTQKLSVAILKLIVWSPKTIYIGLSLFTKNSASICVYPAIPLFIDSEE